MSLTCTARTWPLGARPDHRTAGRVETVLISYELFQHN